MGTLYANVDGSFSGSVKIPNGIVPGAYRLQLNGFTPQVQVRNVSIGVWVTPASGGDITARSRVYFAPYSSTVDAAARRTLRALVAQARRISLDGKAVGYVQPTWNGANDGPLSIARAKAVVAALRDLGLRGNVRAVGAGRGAPPTAQARRVDVQIVYPRR